MEGAKGVIYNSGQLMIIFGTGTVNNVYDAFIEVTGVKELSAAEAKQEGVSKLGKLQQGFKVFSDIFIPFIWEHSPDILIPTEEYEKNGCYSGNGIQIGDELFLYYTANYKTPQGMERTSCFCP